MEGKNMLPHVKQAVAAYDSDVFRNSVIGTKTGVWGLCPRGGLKTKM